MHPQDFASAEEWRVKYEVLARHISDPAVIANAERAARTVIDLATSGVYPLPVVTEMMITLIHRFYIESADSTAQSASKMQAALKRAVGLDKP